MFRVAVRWLPAIVWMTAIFGFSSIPGSDLPPGRYSTFAHFLTYAILGALLALAFGVGRSRGTAVALAVIVAAVYAATDEYHQSFVPLRTPDVADWGVDTLGSFVGAWSAMWLADRLRAWRAAGSRASAQ